MSPSELAEFPSAPSPNGASGMEVMAGLSDLYFEHGAMFKALVSQCFGCPMSPTSSQNAKSFHLVASFGCSAVWINIDSISLILQACLGGNAKDFDVIHLSGWMFKFSIFCKNVGFMITLEVILVRVLPSSSTSGVVEARIGARITLSGYRSKMQSGIL